MVQNFKLRHYPKKKMIYIVNNLWIGGWGGRWSLMDDANGLMTKYPNQVDMRACVPATQIISDSPYFLFIYLFTAFVILVRLYKFALFI